MNGSSSGLLIDFFVKFIKVGIFLSDCNFEVALFLTELDIGVLASAIIC
jgi:hypothetical protein